MKFLAKLGSSVFLLPGIFFLPPPLFLPFCWLLKAALNHKISLNSESIKVSHAAA